VDIEDLANNLIESYLVFLLFFTINFLLNKNHKNETEKYESLLGKRRKFTLFGYKN